MHIAMLPCLKTEYFRESCKMRKYIRRWRRLRNAIRFRRPFRNVSQLSWVKIFECTLIQWTFYATSCIHTLKNIHSWQSALGKKCIRRLIRAQSSFTFHFFFFNYKKMFVFGVNPNIKGHKFHVVYGGYSNTRFFKDVIFLF